MLLLAAGTLHAQETKKLGVQTKSEPVVQNVAWGGFYTGVQLTNQVADVFNRVDAGLSGSAVFRIRKNYAQFQIIIPLNNHGMVYRMIVERKLF